MPSRQPPVPSPDPSAARAAGRAYHHGDLRAALLAAAEEELRAHGPVGFSLRATARRAQVSHGAPAHHFANAEALLAALAEVGFGRLADRIAAGVEAAGADPADRLAASGRAYVDFARGDAHLFRLMFQGGRPAREADCGEGAAASQRAFGQLRDCVAAVLGPGADDAASAAGILTAWGVVHGIAHLAIEGAGGFLGPLDAAVDAAIAGVARSLQRSGGPR
jgi:AcrR family transcriptional regulator